MLFREIIAVCSDIYTKHGRFNCCMINCRYVQKLLGFKTLFSEISRYFTGTTV